MLDTGSNPVVGGRRLDDWATEAPCYSSDFGSLVPIEQLYPQLFTLSGARQEPNNARATSGTLCIPRFLPCIYILHHKLVWLIAVYTHMDRDTQWWRLCWNVYFDHFDFCTIFSPYFLESRFLEHKNRSKFLFFVGTLKTPYIAIIDGVTMGGVRYWINISLKSLARWY